MNLQMQAWVLLRNSVFIVYKLLSRTLQTLIGVNKSHITSNNIYQNSNMFHIDYINMLIIHKSKSYLCTRQWRAIGLCETSRLPHNLANRLTDCAVCQNYAPLSQPQGHVEGGRFM
jgi:hypothetical protein